MEGCRRQVQVLIIASVSSSFFNADVKNSGKIRFIMQGLSLARAEKAVGWNQGEIFSIDDFL